MTAPMEALAALLGGDLAAVRSSPPLMAVLGTLAGVLLLVIVFMLRALSRSSRRDAVLLVGPCGAGKTALFSLVRSRAPQLCVGRA